MQSEVNTVVEEYAPPMISSQQFEEIVNLATNDKFGFLTINMKVPWQTRFRRNLDQFLTLPQSEEEQEETTTATKDKKSDFCANTNSSQRHETILRAIASFQNGKNEPGDDKVQQTARRAGERFDGKQSK